MPTFRIAVPIAGVQVFEVDDASTEAEAFDLILSGEIEPVDAGAVDIDEDTNNWKCAELRSDDEGEGLNGSDSAPPTPKNGPNEALSDFGAPSGGAPATPEGDAEERAGEGQQTFGPAVGMAPVVPVAKRTYDQRTCSDGITRMHDDVFYDSRDNAHGTAEERHEADVAIVTAILMQEDEWVKEYTNGQCGNTDFIDGYRYIIEETDDVWPGRVEEWIQDNYNHTLEVDEELTSRICDALNGLEDCEPEFNEREFRVYSGDGCCLNGWSIEEYENQIEIAGHSELKALHDQRRLDDILDDVNCDVGVHRRRKWVFVKDTGRYEYTGRKTYDPDSRWPDLLAYHNPGGRWDWVVSVDSMRRLYHASLVDYLRCIDSNG